MAPRSMLPASLASAAVGATVRIVRASLASDTVGGLGAVGLDAGELVTVLRRGALGGPLHVRTSSGGEFAVAREIALKLEVEPSP